MHACARLLCFASAAVWLPAMLACAQVAGLEKVTLRPGSGGGAGSGAASTTGTGTGAGGAAGGADGGCAADYASEVMADQPLAYWRLGEDVAAVASDETGQHDGSYLGAPAVGVPGALTCGDDGAVELDGSTQYIDFGDVFEFSGNATFSVELWLRPEVIDGDARHVIAHRTDSDPDTLGWGMFVDADTLDFRRWFAGSARDLVDAPLADFEVGQYTYVVATYDGAELRLYIDALLIDTEASTAPIEQTDSVLLVGRPYATSERAYFGGFLDEIAIYDHALDATRILAHYDAATGN